jgi:DNA-binding NarL/FixJ family response regulator
MFYALKVYVDSPHRLIRDGLAGLISQHHILTGEAEAEVAVRDLCSYNANYPPPPPVPTLALICGSDVEVVEALRLGYRGIFRLEEGVQTLERALRALLRGENWAERHVVAAALDVQQGPHPSNLTKREREIYDLAVLGHTNAEVARQLGVSVNTVKVHLSNVLHKLNVKNRAELIVRSQQRHNVWN